MYTKHCSKFSFAVQQSIMVVVTKAFVLCWNFVGTTPLLWWEASTLERTLSLFLFLLLYSVVTIASIRFLFFRLAIVSLAFVPFSDTYLFPVSLFILFTYHSSSSFSLSLSYNERPHETLCFLFNVLSIIQQIFCSSPFLSFPNTVTLLCLFCPFVYDAFYLFLSLSPRVD